MRTFSLAALLAVLCTQAPIALVARDQQATSASRTRSSFDFDWRFRAGEVDGGQAPALDDAAWEKVDLPHDFMIEGKGQAIVVPGGRAGGGGGAAARRCPTKPEGPFDPRSPGGNSQRLPERRPRLVSQDVHAAGDRARRAASSSSSKAST